MRSLQLKVPPLAVVAAAAGLMWAAARLVPAAAVAIPARVAVAGGLALAGVVVCALGVGSFRRAGTTVNPMAPGSASSLVQSGIYRVTRNPMYLGFLLVLAGWGVLLANVLAFFGPLAFVAYLNAFQIGPEERALAALFGPEYAAYRSRVRRWV
jgi:protein-S-isoprenylcysteine O-methyltransferase Ste14